jgi:hypothetical protein
MKSHLKLSRCVICHQPATQAVDGEPSCDKHVELIYENQLEDYTRQHLADTDWSQLLTGQTAHKEH